MAIIMFISFSLLNVFLIFNFINILNSIALLEEITSYYQDEIEENYVNLLEEVAGADASWQQGSSFFRSDKPIEEVAKDTERDNWMSAQDAVNYGLIDSVVEKR
jgi:hypothetical protein